MWSSRRVHQFGGGLYGILADNSSRVVGKGEDKEQAVRAVNAPCGRSTTTPRSTPRSRVTCTYRTRHESRARICTSNAHSSPSLKLCLSTVQSTSPGLICLACITCHVLYSPRITTQPSLSGRIVQFCAGALFAVPLDSHTLGCTRHSHRAG